MSVRLLLSLVAAVTIVTAAAAQEATPAPASSALFTEDQLDEEQNKAIASLPPAGATNVLFLERFPERIQEFVNPGKYVPLHLQERLSEEIVLKAKRDEKGAERVLRAHLEMLDRMERLARTKQGLTGPFNETLGKLALCYRKLERDQQDFEAAKKIFSEIRDQNLELAAVINPDVTPPGPVLEALTRANVIRPEQVAELKTMEQVVNALRAKREEVDKVNRETLMAMMEAALARKYLQEKANAFVASRMAELTAEATMLNDAIAADNQDTHAAMVHNMMQLAGELGYHEGFGSDPFSQQIRDTIDRFRKGQKVDIGRLFEDEFRDTIAGRFKALQAGDVINPDYADRYLGIVNRNFGRPDVGIRGFDPERFRRTLNDFGYDPNRFRGYEERQRKMREAGENCYRQGKVPFVKNYENAEIECRDRSYVAGPSPEQYRAKQEECAKQGKGVRWLGGDQLECGDGSPQGGGGSKNPCPEGLYPFAKGGVTRIYDDKGNLIPGSYECNKYVVGPPGSPSYPTPGPTSCPPPGVPDQNHGINPATGRCEPNIGTATYTSSPTSTYGSPTTPCATGQYWVQRGGNWGCENYYNANNSQECPPGYYGVSGVQFSCWLSSSGSSPTYTSTPYTPPSYTSYAPYCGPVPYTQTSGWYINPNANCPSGQYPNDTCPTKAKVTEMEADAKKYNYTFNYTSSYSRCPNPPTQ